MIKIRFLLAFFLVVVSNSVTADKAPIPKMEPGGSAIGIEINLRAIIGGIRVKSPDVILFVKTDPSGGLTQWQLLPSDHVKDGRAYLLNVFPGVYVAVAAVHHDIRATLQSGSRRPAATYFSRELAESTRVSVGTGEFAFMGSFRVRQGTMRSSDPVQTFYAGRIVPPRGGFPYTGRAEQSNREENTRRQFLSRAKGDLADGGWGELVLAALDPSTKPAQADASAVATESPVALARMLVDRAEGLTQGTPVDDRLVESASNALRAYVEANPDDVDALIASASLAWLMDIFTGTFVMPGAKPAPGLVPAYETAHGHLDRAITLQPQNAEAHYWKARLFGASVPDTSGDVIDFRLIDAGQSIAFARKAIALAPGDARYTELLAHYLAGQQDYEEAMKVLESLPDGRQGFLFELLHDFAIFPVPEKASFNRIGSRGLADMLALQSYITGYPDERVRAYVIPGPAPDVETFFRQRWPKFKLPRPKRTGEKATLLSLYQVAFRLDDGGWVMLKSPPDRPKDVMLMMLVEHRNADQKTRRQLPVPVGDVYCTLNLINYRSTAP